MCSVRVLGCCSVYMSNVHGSHYSTFSSKKRKKTGSKNENESKVKWGCMQVNVQFMEKRGLTTTTKKKRCVSKAIREAEERKHTHTHKKKTMRSECVEKSEWERKEKCHYLAHPEKWQKREPGHRWCPNELASGVRYWLYAVNHLYLTRRHGRCGESPEPDRCMVWQAAGGRCRSGHTRACSHPGQTVRKTHGTVVEGEVQPDAKAGKTDAVETGSWTGPKRSNQRKRRIHQEVEVACHTPARRRWHWGLRELRISSRTRARISDQRAELGWERRADFSWRWKRSTIPLTVGW